MKKPSTNDIIRALLIVSLVFFESFCPTCWDTIEVVEFLKEEKTHMKSIMVYEPKPTPAIALELRYWPTSVKSVNEIIGSASPAIIEGIANLFILEEDKSLI